MKKPTINPEEPNFKTMKLHEKSVLICGSNSGCGSAALQPFHPVP
jgi:hypothetical protein